MNTHLRIKTRFLSGQTFLVWCKTHASYQVFVTQNESSFEYAILDLHNPR